MTDSQNIIEINKQFLIINFNTFVIDNYQLTQVPANINEMMSNCPLEVHCWTKQSNIEFSWTGQFEL